MEPKELLQHVEAWPWTHIPFVQDSSGMNDQILLFFFLTKISYMKISPLNANRWSLFIKGFEWFKWFSTVHLLNISVSQFFYLLINLQKETSKENASSTA